MLMRVFALVLRFASGLFRRERGHMFTPCSRSIPIIVSLALGFAVNRCAAAQGSQSPQSQNRTDKATQSVEQAGFSGQGWEVRFQAGLARLLEEGRGTQIEVLLGQLRRSSLFGGVARYSDEENDLDRVV